MSFLYLTHLNFYLKNKNIFFFFLLTWKKVNVKTLMRRIWRERRGGICLLGSMVWWNLYTAKGGCCFGLGLRRICVSQKVKNQNRNDWSKAKKCMFLIAKFSPIRRCFLLNEYARSCITQHPFNMLLFFLFYFFLSRWKEEEESKIILCFPRFKWQTFLSLFTFFKIQTHH